MLEQTPPRLAKFSKRVKFAPLKFNLPGGVKF
jgi:hypothetical protein